VLLTGDLSPVD